LGVGQKWPSKAWPMQNWEELVTLLEKENFNLLLLGGLDEKDKMERLKNNYNFLIDTGSNNTVMEFTAIIDQCDIIITSDTLALHIATALGKKIIAFFGPTSASEIELYGKGVKIVSPKECNCYYKRFCTESVPCLSEISASDVFNVLTSLSN
jgi:heptosyltransferase-2